MTRLTPDERHAIEAEIAAARAEVTRLQALLAASDVASYDTVRMLPPVCPCGLPRGHRHPSAGEPTPCIGETTRIARVLPLSVTRDGMRLGEPLSDADADLLSPKPTPRGDR